LGREIGGEAAAVGGFEKGMKSAVIFHSNWLLTPIIPNEHKKQPSSINTLAFDFVIP
jgi:hypothetical protein